MQQEFPETLVRQRIAANRVELCMHPFDRLRHAAIVKLRLGEHLFLTIVIPVVSEKNALRRQAITARAADLLIVTIEAFGQRIMDDEAHIRPVQLEIRIRRHDKDMGDSIGMLRRKGR